MQAWVSLAGALVSNFHLVLSVLDAQKEKLLARCDLCRAASCKHVVPAACACHVSIEERHEYSLYF